MINSTDVIAAFDMAKFLADLSATTAGETLPDVSYWVEYGNKGMELLVSFYDMQHTCRFEEALISLGKGTSTLSGFVNIVVAIIFSSQNELAALETAFGDGSTFE